MSATACIHEDTKQSVLTDVAKLMRSSGRPEMLFGTAKQLLGFRVRWINTQLMFALCLKHRFDADRCEIVYMTANGQTDCHSHIMGGATFLTLGTEHGLPAPRGGVLMGPLCEPSNDVPLAPFEQRAGEFVTVPAGTVHAFYSGPDGELNALGFIHPRIRGRNSYDIVDYDLIGTTRATRRAK